MTVVVIAVTTFTVQLFQKPSTSSQMQSTPYRLNPDKMEFVQTKIATVKNKILPKTLLIIGPGQHRLLLLRRHMVGGVCVLTIVN